MQKVIYRGRLAVVIYSQSPKRFETRLYVNCNKESFGLGDSTLTTGKFLSLEMAENWAKRKLQGAKP